MVGQRISKVMMVGYADDGRVVIVGYGACDVSVCVRPLSLPCDALISTRRELSIYQSIDRSTTLCGDPRRMTDICGRHQCAP